MTNAVPPAPDPSLPRCWWVQDAAGDPLMTRYHDEEWGVPIGGEVELFERFALETFQAGLSWATILRKREAFRRAFDGFDPEIVAAYGPADRERLEGDAGIVRNRAKIAATIDNARAFLALGPAGSGFAALLDRFVPPPPPCRPPAATSADLPATTPAAEALARELRSRGFRFVGPTIVYAFLQSAGWVDDHLPGCFRYRG